jgi:hypothetical protein
MWITSSDSDYAMNQTGIKVQFFYKKELQCELEIRTNMQARKILEDWARLKISPIQVKYYQELIKGYIGAQVDDVTVGKDGKYYLKGKGLAEI